MEVAPAAGEKKKKRSLFPLQDEKLRGGRVTKQAYNGYSAFTRVAVVEVHERNARIPFPSALPHILLLT